MFMIKPSFVKGLGEVFVLGACLLSVLRIPTVLTAPVGQSAMELNGKPRWINPCEIDPATLVMNEDNITQHAQLKTVLLQTENALNHARKFRNEYVKHTFHVDFNDHHNAWKTSINYENWLPKIDKSLGEGTPEEHLANLEFDTSLKDIYKFLQVFAVALEQLIYDMKVENEPFSQYFEEAFGFVNAALCEYQFVMLERGVTPHPDVTREIMSDDLRKIASSTERNLRDWVIFRDYMNTLEYAVEVLNHLKSKSLEAN
ncbi:uncharacterized protein LOC123298325 isoform X2 [Chrysoperla carnea]|uniref:uncharacterized protein LOC123298325 isoform X2 n=1 Tax=Chrysoperla carnea TaxID=189513 RepID=UPI001D0986F3|nr:uncharacterized protein LOC123298325 isoform X2 [Chrysoperla carnea]